MLIVLQVNYKNSELNEKDRYKEGQPNSHQANDPSTFLPWWSSYRLQHSLTATTEDERSIANKLARESKREGESESENFETMQSKKDSTLPVSFGACRV